MEARTDDLGVVVGGGSSDIELSDCDFLHIGGSKRVQSLDESTALASLEMGLCADTVDSAGVGLVDTVDQVDHTSDFGIVRVEIVVVDVKAIGR